MNTNIILQLYRHTKQAEELNRWLAEGNHNIYIDGLMASGKAVMAALCAHHGPHLMVANDRETAAYLYHDLTQLLGEKPIFFLPSSYKRSAENGEQDAQNILMRTEALSMILSGNEPNLYIVTYPEALTEKVISAEQLDDNTLKISVGDRLDISFTIDVLNEYHFERVDFVFEPGQYAVRGSIIDIYSFSDENPFRIDFFGDEVDSIRSFDLESQLSKEKLQQIVIVPNINDQQRMKDTMPLSLALPEKCCIWLDSPAFVTEKMDETVTRIEHYKTVHAEEHAVNRDFFCNGAEWIHHLKGQTVVVYGTKNELKSQKEI